MTQEDAEQLRYYADVKVNTIDGKYRQGKIVDVGENHCTIRINSAFIRSGSRYERVFYNAVTSVAFQG